MEPLEGSGRTDFHYHQIYIRHFEKLLFVYKEKCVCCLLRILCRSSGGHAFSWGAGAILWVALNILRLWLVSSHSYKCLLTTEFLQSTHIY